jgi:hypothetical protein
MRLKAVMVMDPDVRHIEPARPLYELTTLLLERWTFFLLFVRMPEKRLFSRRLPGVEVAPQASERKR